MLTLCFDTSNLYLGLGLFRDGEIIGSECYPCFKKQSEEIFPKLIKLLEDNGVKPLDIDEVVITRGPGSYTGVRIAMAIAKVFCKLSNKPLYTINSLRLYAGNETCRVIIDARGERVYTAKYVDGKEVEAPNIRYIKDLLDEDINIIGDGELVGKENNWPNYINNFMLVKNDWRLEENVDLLTPEYLKESDSYLVGK